MADADEIAVSEAIARDDLPAIHKVIFTATAAFPEYAGQFAAADGEPAVEEEESPWSGEAEIGGHCRTGNNPLDTIVASGKFLYQKRWYATSRLRFVDVKDDGFHWRTFELVGPGYQALRHRQTEALRRGRPRSPPGTGEIR